ncbi:hypothetical protein CDAR_218471 [Caerostris darwini]|uniref:Uncharacterized protein n=1 Tax=Caerostris darwini TaxID=1538125 RepID=A0AAV4RI52_9ARAC|nr:hypothetical protein CDAR_218471 [Caerostris darwini]
MTAAALFKGHSLKKMGKRGFPGLNILFPISWPERRVIKTRNKVEKIRRKRRGSFCRSCGLFRPRTKPRASLGETQLQLWLVCTAGRAPLSICVQQKVARPLRL